MIQKMVTNISSGGDSAHNSDLICSISGSVGMFVDAENNNKVLDSTISKSGSFISVSRNTSNLVVTALIACHAHGFKQLAGTANVEAIDKDCVAGETIISGNYYAILEAY